MTDESGGGRGIGCCGGERAVVGSWDAAITGTGGGGGARSTPLSLSLSQSNRA